MLKCRLMADNAMDYFGVMTDGDTARAWGQIIGTMQHMFGMLHADTAMESLLADDGAARRTTCRNSRGCAPTSSPTRRPSTTGSG